MSSKKAKAWAKANKWFGELPGATAIAISIHERLLKAGIKVDSDKYYEELDKRLKKYEHEIAEEAMAKKLGTWEEWFNERYDVAGT